MTFEEMLRRLGAAAALLTDEQRDQLDTDGFVVLTKHLAPARVDRYADAIDQLLAAEGADAGSEFRQEHGAPRLSNLMSKGRIFEEAAVDPAVLSVVAHIISGPFKLHGCNERDALKGQGHQPLHTDWGPRQQDEPYRIVNTLWFVDDLTPTNGATRLVPGSHCIDGAVADHVGDPLAPHPDQILTTGPRGTVVVYNAHLWHGGTRNESGVRRRVMHVSYVDRNYPQQLDQKQVLDPGVHHRLAPEVRYLLDVD